MDFIKKTDYQDIAYSIDSYASYLNYSSPFHFFYSNPRFGCLGLYIYVHLYLHF